VPDERTGRGRLHPGEAQGEPHHVIDDRWDDTLSPLRQLIHSAEVLSHRLPRVAIYTTGHRPHNALRAGNGRRQSDTSSATLSSLLGPNRRVVLVRA